MASGRPLRASDAPTEAADQDRAGGAPRLGALGNRVRGALEAGLQASLAQLQDEALVRRLREERVE
jgi:hypothetical protein